jgi:hypothetical protein
MDSYDATVVRAQAQAAQTGVLTATGTVTVNGNQAATGLTILTGSVISVGGGGHAIIDLGPLGRTELGQGTTVTLQMLGNVQESTLTQCGDETVTVPNGITGRVTIPQPQTARVSVSQGKVTVRYDNNLEKVLVAGNTERFLNVTEVVSDGNAAVFQVCCGACIPPAVGGFPFSPWWFLLAVPVGLGIGLGITQTGGGPPPVLSPVVPG